MARFLPYFALVVTMVFWGSAPAFILPWQHRVARQYTVLRALKRVSTVPSFSAIGVINLATSVMSRRSFHQCAGTTAR